MLCTCRLLEKAQRGNFSWVVNTDRRADSWQLLGFGNMNVSWGGSAWAQHGFHFVLSLAQRGAEFHAKWISDTICSVTDREPHNDLILHLTTSQTQRWREQHGDSTQVEPQQHSPYPPRGWHSLWERNNLFQDLGVQSNKVRGESFSVLWPQQTDKWSGRFHAKVTIDRKSIKRNRNITTSARMILKQIKIMNNPEFDEQNDIQHHTVSASKVTVSWLFLVFCAIFGLLKALSVFLAVWRLLW